MRDIWAERKSIETAIAGQTLCSVFDRTVARLGDADALVHGSRKWSWREYREQTRDVALGLRELGLAPGAFAVLLSRNRPEHVIADLGVVHAGGTPVSLYTTLAPDQIAYIANHCEAKVAFVEDAAFLARVQAIRNQLPHLEHIVLLEGEGEGAVSWPDLLAKGRAAHDKNPKAFDAMW
jgi:long-chain acyl-CoA synthetase